MCFVGLCTLTHPLGKRTCLKSGQDRNRNADIENGRVDTGWEEEGGMNSQIRFDIITLPCVK